MQRSKIEHLPRISHNRRLIRLGIYFLTDLAVTGNVTLSKTEQCLARLGVRPEEKSVTALLFGNMFMSGIAIGMIRVCALTLFLKHYGSEQLALIAILLALIGMPVTIIIDRVTHALSIRSYLFTILGTITVGLIFFRSLLGITDSNIVIFTLPLFFEVVYMLFSLQFIALLTRLLNVRQTKRLSGITRSGEFLAEMVGGMLVVLLLNLVSIEDLLLVAIISTGLVFAIVQFTVSHFSTNLVVRGVDENVENDTRLFGMLRLNYVKLIALCYSAYMFAYFFLDVAFYGYATEQFPDEHQLAEFIAQFFAISGLLTLFTMVFLFAPILRRFGIMFGILTFPIVVFVGSSSASALELFGAGTTFVFAIMVLTNGLRFVLQSAIWKPTVTILFQVLPDRQRTKGTSLIEGVVDPLAGGIAGVCLYVLSETLNWEPKFFLLVLSVLMLCWIAVSFVVRKHYLANLVLSIQKRKVGELAISDLDNASLDIIKGGIDSSYPAEVFYCLNLLEEIEHPEITELIKQVLSNNNREVRLDVLRRIASMDIKPLTSIVLKHIESESDSGVRGEALITYSSLKPDDVVEKLAPYLNTFHKDLKRGALIGILSYEPTNDIANDFLLGAIRGNSSERIFAADVISEIGDPHFSEFLVELFADLDNEVLEKAIYAAGRLRDLRLLNELAAKLSNPAQQVFVCNALRQYGEAALYELEAGLSSPESGRVAQLHMIDIIREIGGTAGMEILLRHIDIEQPELQHQIYVALATLRYQSDPDDQYIFGNKIEEEVQTIAFLLAAMEDLYEKGEYRMLHAALGNELDIRRDNMLLLISFIFPSIVMLDARANIDSKVAELRTFALEVLDNLLTGDIKQIVLPVLDDLTVTERLETLSNKFPQEHLEPKARFDNIMETHFENAFFWTRSSLIYLVGQLTATEHIDHVRQSLNDPEAINRETSAWSLVQLKPADLRRILVAHSSDENPGVRAVVQGLLSVLPPTEPA
ncbi:MAG TPA: hypothetical protein DCM54_17465 [Gammaproteobacteria bacterium]|nr:hypothetical protein [Gammaproteobacteria bacterium]